MDQESKRAVKLLFLAVALGSVILALVFHEVLPFPDSPEGKKYLPLVICLVIGGYLFLYSVRTIIQLRRDPAFCPSPIESFLGTGFCLLRSGGEAGTENPDHVCVTLWLRVFYLPVAPLRRYRTHEEVRSFFGSAMRIAGLFVGGVPIYVDSIHVLEAVPLRAQDPLVLSLFCSALFYAIVDSVEVVGYAFLALSMAHLLSGMAIILNRGNLPGFKPAIAEITD